MAKKAKSEKESRVRVVCYLDAPQLAALQGEAIWRMQASGAQRLDVSEVIREAVGLWLAWKKR